MINFICISLYFFIGVYFIGIARMTLQDKAVCMAALIAAIGLLTVGSLWDGL